MKYSPVPGFMPPKAMLHTQPFVPATTRSGSAGASALKSRSQSCIAISQPAATAAGCCACTTEPGRLRMSISR
ncbi:MAG TPA: hypothetical protein VNQ54_10285 [Methylomirabilota bacterium]|nr:hypothetical protein [Methylomirabilota bacterium]